MPIRPRIVLVQAPAFVGRGPSNAIALLCAHLKDAGFSPLVHDASLGARKSLARRAGLARPAHFEHPEDLLLALRKSPRFLKVTLDREARAIAAHRPEIVGFSVLVATEECSLALARRVKELSPKTAIVLGGPQCLRETMAFDLIERDCVDAVALGEADRSLVELARRFPAAGGPLPRVPGFLVKESGRVVDCGNPIEIENLDTLPFMDFSGFDLAGYDSDCLYLNGSRGCVRQCSFCTHILQQKVYRRMSAERIAAEVRHQLSHYPGKYFIEFGDSLVNGDVRRLARFSELMVPLRLERAARREVQDFGWGGMAIIHPTMTPSLLRAMNRGGCQTLAYGLESASQRVVDLMRKNFRVEDAARVIRDTKDAGISVKLFLLVGFPGETEADFQETLRFVEKHAGVIDGAGVSYCEIQKGSHLDAHPEDYGVRLPLLDRKRWTTTDGSNDYDARRRRFEELSALAARLGISTERRPRAKIFDGSGRESLRA